MELIINDDENLSTSEIVQRGELDNLRELTVAAPPALPCVRVIDFNSSMRLFSSYNDTFSIATIFRAESEFAFQGRKHLGRSGSVCFLEPEAVFRHDRIPISERIGMLQIDTHVVEQAARELGVGGGIVHFRNLFSRSKSLFAALTKFHNCLHREDSPLELQTEFVTCLRLIIEHRVGGAPRFRVGYEPFALRAAREYLHAHFTEKVTIDDLAGAAGVPAHHLRRLFTRGVGLPPHAYQNHLRLTRACRLIEEGVPLSAIATDVGFTDQSHLSRHFRRALGFPPGTWPKRVQAE